MALFQVPKRAGRAQDNSILKKTKTAKKVSTTIKGGGVLGRINEIKAAVEKNLGHLKDNYVVITDELILNDYLDTVIYEGVLAVDTETNGLDPLQDDIVGVCIYVPTRPAAYIPINHISYVTGVRVENQLSKQQVADFLWKVCDTNSTDILMHNAKFDIRFIRNQLDVRNIYCTWDTMLAARVLNENEESNGLKQLWKKYCNNGKGDAFNFDSLFNGVSFDKVPINTGYIYAANDAKITYELYRFQQQYLRLDHERQDMADIAWVFHNIEMPCVNVVADMEDTGVGFDLVYQEKLSAKYNELLDQKTQQFYSFCNSFNTKISKYKSVTPNHKLSDPISVSSPTQLAILFYDILQVGVVDKKAPRGTGEAVLQKLSQSKDKDIANLSRSILEWREISKLLSTYIDKLPDCVNPKDGRVHCSFNQYGAATGRFSCISEGSKISSPSGDKNIEDMQIGDWVYCYDNYNRLTLSKVKNVWFTGVRNCVRLKWKSKYNTKLTGELICTPDHFIKTERGWVMAKDLTSADSILYVHRRVDTNNVALYGWKGQGSEEEHNWIKSNYFKSPDSKLQLHHVDGNHTNNNPDNLTITTPKAHNNCHRHDGLKYNKSFGGGYNWTEDDLLEMGESVNWELSKLPFDYYSLLKWYKNYGINYILKYTESYSVRNYVIRPNDKARKALHLPLNKTNLQYALELSCGNVAIASGYFGISLKQFEQACDRYELLSNHSVVSIEYLTEPYNVYDLEVGGYHNFIANELCVHNSSDPNLQNIPSHNKDIRKMFVATPGYVLMSSDYSQQEPKIMTQMCGDKKMIQAYQEGKDLYAEIASLAFNKPYEDCLEFRPDGTTNKDGKERRSQAKSILLGVLYGRGVPSIAEQLGTTTKKAQQIKDSVFKGFPAIPRFEKDSYEMAEELGYVTTLWGRKRRLPDLQLEEYEFRWKDGAPPDDDLLDFDDMNPPEYNNAEIPEDRKQYYLTKLHKTWGSQKRSIFEEANDEGIWIVDNGGKIADAQRQCVNSRIQGSAADMTKLALIMVNNDPELKELGFRLLIPVHDELIGECPKENAKQCAKRFADIMSQAAASRLDIPIKCDVAISYAWYGEEVKNV